MVSFILLQISICILTFYFGNADQSNVFSNDNRQLGIGAKNDDHVVKSYLENGGKVEIILFYGRRRYTKIQLPYLMQNKRQQAIPDDPIKFAPIVSKVHVMLNTNVTEDIKFIRTVASHDPDFFQIHDNVYGLNYCKFYPRFNSTNTMYIKLDDDIVYIHPIAIFSMVKMKLTTTFIFISANVINHSALSKYHLQMGAFSFEHINDEWEFYFKQGHRDVLHTPGGNYAFDGDAWGDHTWRSGPHAFLQHLSFFHFVRVKDIEVFDFGYKDLDKERYYRWSINCFLFEARDMKLFELAKCGTNDELYLSMFLPHDAGDHSGACGAAIMSHFAYTPQRHFLETNTSMLERYSNMSLALRSKLLKKDSSFRMFRTGESRVKKQMKLRVAEER